MASLPRPRRAFRADVRFLIGITLVIASIAGVWFIVSSADHATPVMQARRTITQGEPLTPADFQVVDLGLGPLTDEYLAPQDLQDGQVAARTVRKGEIVPNSLAVDADADTSTTIVIESSTGIPEDVDAGTVVELWHAPPLDDRSYDAPRVLVADAIVRRVIDSEGMLADSGSQVELVIDRTDVADVLAAVTGGSSLSVIPVEAGS